MAIQDDDATYRSHMVDLPGGRFHYLSWGEERTELPAALLLHGVTSNALSWVRVAPALADRYRVYALDLRGHGKSAVLPAGNYSLEDTAGDALALIKALDLRRPLLIGHSWGGATAMVLASGGATEFSRVVLEDPACRMGRGHDPEIYAQRYTKDIGRPREELRREIIEQNPEWTPEDVEGKLVALEQVSKETVVNIFKEVNPAGNLIPLLSRITAPTLLLGADPDNGSTLNVKAWEEARQALPANGRAVRIDGAPHGIHRSCFAAFMRAVDEFLVS